MCCNNENDIKELIPHFNETTKNITDEEMADIFNLPAKLNEKYGPIKIIPCSDALLGDMIHAKSRPFWDKSKPNGGDIMYGMMKSNLYHKWGFTTEQIEEMEKESDRIAFNPELLRIYEMGRSKGRFL